MATSYTSLLGLALPVTGEVAGTWGDTVNNSITSLLDTAVAGTTTLSTDADVTLTTTTGASNQARQAILLCSGARTAQRTITAPAKSKIYVVINNTTGGFGVKLVGAGPTTGITVASGKTAVLVWNGSDFVEVAPATATTATNLAGGAAGSVPYQTGAGATTFLSIGTNNFVLTSNGAAPVWTTNTGTGNVVRATSPTIATPTITTSATVPLLIGGTGTTSTLTLRSTSGVGATGADIIFQTGNNGATEAMRILNSGNVGIGTNAPTQKLHVVGGTVTDLSGTASATAVVVAPTANSNFFTIKALAGNSAGLRLSAAAADDVASITNFYNAALTFGTNNTERMRIDSAGNVGLGVTPSAWGATYRMQQIGYGAAVGGRTAAAQAYLSANWYQDGTGNKYIYNGFATQYQQDSGVHYWYNAPSGTAGNAITFTQAMTLDSSGNLGLGVTPSATNAAFRAFEVGNFTFFSGAGELSSYIDNNAFFNASGQYRYKNSGYAGEYAMFTSDGSHRWYTAPSGTAGNAITFTQAMTLSASGNLGIGTASPVNKLQINGSLGRNAPVTKTGSFTLADTENWLICNGTGTITVTLPAASSWTGREVMIKTIAAFTVVSASSNVVPLAGGAAGTAILPATAGSWATLVSDGTNWIIMQS